MSSLDKLSKKRRREISAMGGRAHKGRKLTEEHKQRIRETKLRQAEIVRNYQKEHGEDK